MKGTQEIKSRIKGVRDTVKITKAMYSISAAKMSKTANRADQANRYYAAAKEAVCRLYSTPLGRAFFETQKNATKNAWIVAAADKGLCGDYNDRVFAAFANAIEEGRIAKGDTIYSVGYAARQYLKGIGIRSDNQFTYMMQNPLPLDAQHIADVVMEEVAKGEIGTVYVLYTAANKLFDQEVVCEQLLPLPDGKQDEVVLMDKEDVPDLIRLYLKAKLYAVLCSASYALNYKRMTGMQQATKNGEEMLQTLLATYNRERQERITSELNDANGAKIAQEEGV